MKNFALNLFTDKKVSIEAINFVHDHHLPS